MIRRILLFVLIYLVCEEISYNLITIYNQIIIEYKHSTYIYDCLYASCFHEKHYIKCKCIL